MSHSLGYLKPVSGTPRIGPDSGTPPTSGNTWDFPPFTPAPAAEGTTPRFVMLHFTSMVFPAGARLEVDVRYGTDVFDMDGEGWTRPIDVAPGPISIRYIGNGSMTGGVTFTEYASGELKTDTAAGEPAFQPNPDVFLEFLTPAGKFAEPIYETRGRCGATFDWENVKCTPSAIELEASRAVCMFVARDSEGLVLSSCSGTLIGPDLVLTAEHCVSDPTELEAVSGSVTFDFQTECDGSKPMPYNPLFHKIRRVIRRGTTYDPSPSSAAIDWAILQIETPPGGLGITPRKLRPTGPMAGEHVFAIHHPNGSVKKLQRITLPGASVAGLPQLDVCGGSSGSALFDANGDVIGGAAHAAGMCSVTYCAATDILAALANPPAPPAPYDVMLVMDRSGSMGDPGGSTPGSTKMEDAQQAADLFVSLVRNGAGDKLGMVSFSASANRPPDTPLAAVSNAQKSALMTAIGNLHPDTSTSIGDGLKAAAESLTPGANRRAVLLMTDGLQNTPPTIEDGESHLGDAQVFVVGFGAEGDLDGPRMTTLAGDHNGIFQRAGDGLQLKKFFSLAFGNIFEAGALADPEHLLRAPEVQSKAVTFRVCEEERITAVLGWNDPSQTLELSLRTPGGATINAGSPGIESVSGGTWHFLRVPLPHGGERAGLWSWQVSRIIGGGEFPPPQADVRYFVNVLASGGPRLVPLPATRRYYTGDPVTPLVSLRYGNGTRTQHTTVELDIEAPNASIGALVAAARLQPAQLGGDIVDPFHATLQRIEKTQGPIARRTLTVPLYDDGDHDDGAMERDGIFGDTLTDLTRFEGTYTFHARAAFGEGCVASREAFWSLTVEPSIDPGRTVVVPVDGGVRITPNDVYGNPLGPGRGDRFTVSGLPGVVVTGPPVDNGDGSYTVPVSADPGATPGVIVTQPGRPPVPLTPKQPEAPECVERWWKWAAIILFLLLVLLVLILLWTT
jgi:von Willebrand factor type A domain/Trypsin-like peptidase domain